jgi:hypothetical protein
VVPKIFLLLDSLYQSRDAIYSLLFSILTEESTTGRESPARLVNLHVLTACALSFREAMSDTELQLFSTMR